MSKSKKLALPSQWPQADKDALHAKFARARSEGLWFFHGGTSGPLWFSPAELIEEMHNNRFVWGAENWTLRDPIECLQGIQAQRDELQREIDRFIDRWVKSVQNAGAS